ncbi:proline-rich protein 2-like [Mesoplodon densirostris]|uniref:proline-rich protein 2-like n=1 Tax=Mesoplodon densirostris TaxID=48708 RepID=UPI0028DC7884|nr:proline-rich protein 2-like [Mesoplodon densirostris]
MGVTGFPVFETLHFSEPEPFPGPLRWGQALAAMPTLLPRKGEKPRGPRAPSDGSFKEKPPPPPSQPRPAVKFTGRIGHWGFLSLLTPQISNPPPAVPKPTPSSLQRAPNSGRTSVSFKIEQGPSSFPCSLKPDPFPRTRGPEAEGSLAGVQRRGPRSPALPSHPPRPHRLRGADPGPGRFVPPRARSRRRPTKLPLCPAASAGPDDVSLRDPPGGAQHGLLRPLAAEGGRARLGAPPSRGGPFTEPFPQAQRAADP